MRKPYLLVILVDDLRYDEFGAGGHPYMKTPHIDRLAAEGVLFERAFHTTPICSPNRASIVTGQYASRHGIIDNVARDAMSHRLPNYHIELQKLGYLTAHIGKWHMGNDGMPRPGYDLWVSYDGHGQIVNPRLNHDGQYVEHTGYVTDLMNSLAVEFIARKHDRPWSLFLAHKRCIRTRIRPRTARSTWPASGATSQPSAIETSTGMPSSRKSRICSHPPRWRRQSPPGPRRSS
jgi:arylsulfatase A-like enzyme